jgi:adenylate cyclase
LSAIAAPQRVFAGTLSSIVTLKRIATATQEVETLANPKLLWPYLAQTDRTNRLIGAPPVQFQALSRKDTSARYLATAKAFGLTLRYEELPFEWEEERKFVSTRVMLGGPLRGYRYTLELTPGSAAKSGGSPTGSHVRLNMEVEPRSAVPLALARAFADKFMKDNARVVRELDAYLAGQAKNPFAMPIGPSSHEALTRARKTLERLGVSAALVEKICDLVEAGADADVLRVRPHEQARNWDMPRLDVLKAFLAGVQSGLFELRWALVCPSCMVSADTYKDFGEITPPGHCQLCDIQFDVELDKAVEAVFVPHPAIRAIEERPFCIGGPGRTPHVRSQCILPARGDATMRAPSEPGRYRLFFRGGKSVSLEVRQDHATADVEVVFSESDVRPAEATVVPGGAIRLMNTANAESHAKLEYLGFASLAATAHEVANLPEFARVFSRALIKPKTPMKVSYVTLLFTDLVGSTALYSDLGDAEAFRFVDDHFDVLQRAIAQASGVVVKTMGDAVMASFLDAQRALAAADNMLRDFNVFCKQKGARYETVALKVGMYSGPCYVVTANEISDYFGQTVNIAARLQGLAGPGELIITAADYDDISARGSLEEKERFSTRVKGVSEELLVVRVAPGTR